MSGTDDQSRPPSVLCHRPGGLAEQAPAEMKPSAAETKLTVSSPSYPQRVGDWSMKLVSPTSPAKGREAEFTARQLRPPSRVRQSSVVSGLLPLLSTWLPDARA